MSKTPEQVTFGDKAVETSTFDRYKGVKGRTDRIAILSAKLLRGNRYYHERKKTSFRAPENEEVLALCKAQLGEPEQRFALTLFHYNTDEDGNLLDDAKCSGKVKIWQISESRYEELSGLAKEWPLLDGGAEASQHDLIIKCTEEQYQRMSFKPTKDAHWKKKEAWYNALKSKEQAAQKRLRESIGRTLSDQEILDLLGVSPQSATGGTQNASDIDLSDVLDD